MEPLFANVLFQWGSVGTGSRYCSWSPPRRSTGNNLGGHYICDYFFPIFGMNFRIVASHRSGSLATRLVDHYFHHSFQLFFFHFLHAQTPRLPYWSVLAAILKFRILIEGMIESKNSFSKGCLGGPWTYGFSYFRIPLKFWIMQALMCFGECIITGCEQVPPSPGISFCGPLTAILFWILQMVWRCKSWCVAGGAALQAVWQCSCCGIAGSGLLQEVRHFRRFRLAVWWEGAARLVLLKGKLTGRNNKTWSSVSNSTLSLNKTWF